MTNDYIKALHAAVTGKKSPEPRIEPLPEAYTPPKVEERVVNNYIVKELVGPKGSKGDTGEKGEQGIQGIQGPQGDKGDIGIRGPKGEKGDRGDVGERGYRGPKGDTGEKGEQGQQGPIGPVANITEDHLALIVSKADEKIQKGFWSLGGTERYRVLNATTTTPGAIPIVQISKLRVSSFKQLVAGSGVTLTQDANDATITISSSGGSGTVTTDATLIGNGSIATPLGINLNNANTWTAKQIITTSGSSQVTLGNAGLINGNSFSTISSDGKYSVSLAKSGVTAGGFAGSFSDQVGDSVVLCNNTIAGQFADTGGNTVHICDSTYALNVNGDSLFNGFSIANVLIDDASFNLSIDPTNRVLYNGAGAVTVDYTGNLLKFGSGVIAVDFTGFQNAAAKLSFDGTHVYSSQQIQAANLTASTALVSDASKNIISSVTTSTELSYVSGVTSAIQTQLNGKQATGSYITALTGDVTATGPGSVAATIAANAVTNAKLATMAANTVKVNATAGSAVPTDLALSANNLLGRGASGNITACTLASSLSFTTAALGVATNGITNALFRQSAGLSVVGNSSSSTTNVADITAGSSDQVLRVDSVFSTIAWGAINLATSQAVSGLLGPANAGLGIAGALRVKTAPLTNATTAMVAITDLTATVVKPNFYEGTLTIYGNNGTAAGGLKFDFNGGSASITSIEFGFAGSSIGATIGTATSTAAGTALTATLVSSTDIAYTISFIVTFGGNGTFIPRYATNSAGTATINNAVLRMSMCSN